MREIAKRNNQDKPQLSYLLTWPNAIRACAEVAAKGAEEYGEFNYKRGTPVRESIDSLLRHLTALANGEDIDPKSGKPHAGHIVWNSNQLAEALLGPDKERLDDRYKQDTTQAQVGCGSDNFKQPEEWGRPLGQHPSDATWTTYEYKHGPMASCGEVRKK